MAQTAGMDDAAMLLTTQDGEGRVDKVLPILQCYTYASGTGPTCERVGRTSEKEELEWFQMEHLAHQ
jgi:hypothetical protein